MPADLADYTDLYILIDQIKAEGTSPYCFLKV